ncbi:MAG: tRNA (N6-isopentenyl adenosine(37)-C2)-methylthiotransferase MiaB [Syntrophomonadaceae bacterium]|jgi:tRNA-2-methylthio-N6-dimethylallyladenosine synthase|nr:tRNA (N6-isopentenyl adenosine(37)-C2)-methylthiotransferase MiaB [Syntrophomonadaceae bacterium]
MEERTEIIGSYHILTYGCQMNVRDSEILAGIVEGMGYVVTPHLEEADLVIFNTCSVRHSAENKVYGKLGQVAKLKRKNPDMIIAVGGCMAQLENVRKRLKKQQVDIVFGTYNLDELPQMIAERKESGRKLVQIYEGERDMAENLPSSRNQGVTAFVNIMYGCNNFCSYCIVPYTRGRERSRQPEHIMAEIRDLAGQGFKEITLLGQNVNSYGRGLEAGLDFADLLSMVGCIDGIERIRFTTSHPRDMNDKLIHTIAKEPKVCEHIHVAMQAGSNRILQLMNRGYTREHYMERTQSIRKQIPGVAISTDIIVGFPGESEEDFEDTLDMVKRVRFDSAFTFMYSIRSGTKAASLDHHLPLEVRRQRLLTLNEVQYSIAREINQSLVGSTQEVLVEGWSKTDKHMLSSRTRTNRIVIFYGPESLIGRIINVRIKEVTTFSLFGEMLQVD